MCFQKKRLNCVSYDDVINKAITLSRIYLSIRKFLEDPTFVPTLKLVLALKHKKTSVFCKNSKKVGNDEVIFYMMTSLTKFFLNSRYGLVDCSGYKLGRRPHLPAIPYPKSIAITHSPR